MNITFRQLQIFAAVARNLSFTRASEELHLTQPAVSMQIKQLEETLAVSLFEQMGKKESAIKAFRVVCKNWPTSGNASRAHAHLQTKYNISVTLGGAKED